VLTSTGKTRRCLAPTCCVRRTSLFLSDKSCCRSLIGCIAVTPIGGVFVMSKGFPGSILSDLSMGDVLAPLEGTLQCDPSLVRSTLSSDTSANLNLVSSRVLRRSRPSGFPSDVMARFAWFPCQRRSRSLARPTTRSESVSSLRSRVGRPRLSRRNARCARKRSFSLHSCFVLALLGALPSRYARPPRRRLVSSLRFTTRIH
jgi:hypothetical protein